MNDSIASVDDAPHGERPCHLHLRTASHFQRSSSAVVSMDPLQRRILALPASSSVLVLGEAGFGKTTVSLRRLFRLARQAEAARRSFMSLVLVPTEGLRALTQSMLRQLGLGLRAVDVHTVDQWLALQGRRAFPDVPDLDSRDASVGVIRLKRHPAVRSALAALADERGRGSRAKYWDLFHLWGDRALLARIVEASDGQLSQAMARAVVDHACVMFSDMDEDDEGPPPDVDRYGVRLDEGTPYQDAGSIDPEDFAVLFALDRVKRGEGLPAERERPPRPDVESYDHIVLDEAQDVAPMELAVIGRALAPGGSLTVVGDERQQTDPTAYFAGWDALRAELGLVEPDVVVLEESHRCPPAVSSFARAVVDATSESPGRGHAVVVSRFASESLLLAELRRELEALVEHDCDATVALILRTERRAHELARQLRPHVQARLAQHGGFDVRAGITISRIDQVKGLEFDFVVLPDVSEQHYPDTPASRRALYVAATRALHQLWIPVAEEPSPILPARVAARVPARLSAHRVR